MPHGRRRWRRSSRRGNYGARAELTGATFEDAVTRGGRPRRGDRRDVRASVRGPRRDRRARGRSASSSPSSCPRSRRSSFRSAAAASRPGSRSRCRRSRPDVKIVGVQAAACAPLAGGTQFGYTIAEGIAVKHPGELTSSLARRPARVDRHRHRRGDQPGDRAPDSSARSSSSRAPARRRSPRCSRAASPATARRSRILSGGNIDPTLLIQVMRHGLTLAGRYLVVRTRIADRPGELVKLLALFADERANVVSIEHHREGMDTPVTESEVEAHARSRATRSTAPRSSTRCGSAATRSTGCTDAHLSQLRPRERGRRALLLELRHAALEQAAEPAREERKVVTVLFADLVGFTSRAEQLDPEDVRARARAVPRAPAHRARALRRHGREVHRRRGDGAVRRAGRARGRSRAGGPGCARDPRLDRRRRASCRCGSPSTPARRSSRSTRGPTTARGMASGDVVNTAARLQSRRAGERDPRRRDDLPGDAAARSTVRAREPVEAKGKAEPIPVWEALEARSRFGVDVARRARSAARRARARGSTSCATRSSARAQERSPQLVTLVGVPGIGKSRLVCELFAARRRRSRSSIYWRQGRSLPYGEGVTYWALGEMVKAQAGILETDSAEEVSERKLGSVVAEVLEARPDRSGSSGTCRPLVGLAERGAGVAIAAEEAFAAWRRFLEALAEQQPLVLVFEDLHWADDGLLDFVDHLVDWASGVPMLVVCTARARAPRAPARLGRRQAERGDDLALAALRRGHGAPRPRRCSSGRCCRPTRSRRCSTARGQPALRRAVRAAASTSGRGGSGSAAGDGAGDHRRPARRASDEEKLLLQDAAVVGKVFWLGPLTRIGGRDPARRRGCFCTRSSARSSCAASGARPSPARASTSSSHLLVRDVALRPDPARGALEKHQARSGLDRVTRPTRGSRRDARAPPPDRARARSGGRRGHGGADDSRTAPAQGSGDSSDALSAFQAARRFYGAAVELWPARRRGPT